RRRPASFAYRRGYAPRAGFLSIEKLSPETASLDFGNETGLGPIELGRREQPAHGTPRAPATERGRRLTSLLVSPYALSSQKARPCRGIEIRCEPSVLVGGRRPATPSPKRSRPVGRGRCADAANDCMSMASAGHQLAASIRAGTLEASTPAWP